MSPASSVTCASCAASWPDSARWCGRCGAALSTRGAEGVRIGTARPDAKGRVGAGSSPANHPTAGRRVILVATIGIALIAVGLAVSSTSIIDRADRAAGSGNVEIPDPSEVDPEPASPDAEAITDEPSSPSSDGPESDIESRAIADSLDTCRTAANEVCGQTYDIDMDAATGMLAVGDQLLAADTDGNVRSLDIHDGSLRWVVQPPDDLTVVAVSGSTNEDLVTAWTGRRLYGLDAQDGQVRWDHAPDAARLDIGPRNIVLTGDAVLIIYADEVVVLGAQDGSLRFAAPTRPSGTIVLPDGFATLIDGEVARYDTSDAQARWRAQVPDPQARFVPEPPRLGRPWSSAPLAITATDGQTLALAPETGEVILELGADLTHGVQRIGDLLVTVSWPSDDGAMARVTGLRADGTEPERLNLSHPCCEHAFIGGEDGFVGVIDPRPGGRGYLVDLDAPARIELVRPDEVVGQRSADGLSGGIAIWRTSGSRIGANQMTGQVRWRSGSEARLVSLDPVVFAGPRSVVRVDNTR